MKQILLVSMVVIGVVAALGYLFWHAISTLFSDWMIGREVKQIEEASAERREKRRQENAKRLDTGCDHLFDQGFGEFPPGVCVKCGMEQARPLGLCDHRWKRQDGPVPSSICEKCGKVYSSSTVEG